MPDVIWTERGVNEAASQTVPLSRGGAGMNRACDEHAVILDPDLTPDWLRIPTHEGVPPEFRGEQVRVHRSLWFGLAPNPAMDPSDPDTHWLDRRTRWHMLAAPMASYCVAEVAGHGWVLLEVGSARRQMLIDYANETGQKENHSHGL